MKRYPDCQYTNGGSCENCSLSSYGKDCRNNPVNQLAYLRTRAGMTQAELARRSGRAIMHISKLENGYRKITNISLGTAISLADALGIQDLRELVGNEHQLD